MRPKKTLSAEVGSVLSWFYLKLRGSNDSIQCSRAGNKAAAAENVYVSHYRHTQSQTHTNFWVFFLLQQCVFPQFRVSFLISRRNSHPSSIYACDCRELGLDQLLCHCEVVLEKLRFPERDPCYQAMAGTALFTHTAFDMLQNHSRYGRNSHRSFLSI